MVVRCNLCSIAMDSHSADYEKLNMVLQEETLVAIAVLLCIGGTVYSFMQGSWLLSLALIGLAIYLIKEYKQS